MSVVTEYEYVTIIEVEKKPKTSVYHILSKSHGDLLGIVRWHGPWRGYVVDFQEQTIWNETCLKDVLTFLISLRLGRILVKYEYASMCMGCLTIAELTEDAVKLWMVCDEGSEVCVDCNHRDIRLFKRGIQFYPKEKK